MNTIFEERSILSDTSEREPYYGCKRTSSQASKLFESVTLLASSVAKDWKAMVYMQCTVLKWQSESVVQ